MIHVTPTDTQLCSILTHLNHYFRISQLVQPNYQFEKRQKEIAKKKKKEEKLREKAAKKDSAAIPPVDPAA